MSRIMHITIFSDKCVRPRADKAAPVLLCLLIPQFDRWIRLNVKNTLIDLISPRYMCHMREMPSMPVFG